MLDSLQRKAEVKRSLEAFFVNCLVGEALLVFYLYAKTALMKSQTLATEEMEALSLIV